MKRWQAILLGIAIFAAALVATMSAESDVEITTATTATTAATPASTSTAADHVDPTYAPPAGDERATVTRIVDGDTVEIMLLSGVDEVVRLIGMNTPESGECFSEEATVALAALVADEVITMTPDVSDRDQYGRLLRYLWLDRGVFVNEIMVRGGFAQARDYAPDSMYATDIAAAQDLAQSDAIGIWATDACGPSSGTDLRVIEVLPDPPGSDNDNLEGEWVDIVNAGLSDVSMRGWVLKDESSRHRYRFPDDFILASQATVRVRTGCGVDTLETLYWCNGAAVWNNTGDTAFILDPNGNIVSFYGY